MEERQVVFNGEVFTKSDFYDCVNITLKEENIDDVSASMVDEIVDNMMQCYEEENITIPPCELVYQFLY